MLKVLHVISGIDPQNGGPTRALLGLTVAQVRIGIDASVVATYRQPTGPANVPAFESANVPVQMIGPAWGPPSWHSSIPRVLRERIAQCDVVHVHAMFEEIQHHAARIARGLGKPYIIRPCGGLDPWTLARGRLKKRLYLAWRLRKHLDYAAAIHYTTAAERQAAAPLGLKAPTIVEPNGIDLVEFDPLPHKGLFRATRPEIGGRRIVLFLGRIDPKKGLDLLIPAFARANPPDTVLVLAGPDSFGYERQMRRLADREGLADRTIFPGMLHGRARIEALVDADLFVMPSYVENFGISVIEAMAAGLPVILSDQVNLSTDLPPTVGQTIRLDTQTALAQAITAWLCDAPRRHAAGIAGRALALARYDWRCIADRFSDHYTRLSK
jgi:glycosyltransferase involved in cell wall biosynthesis